MQLQVGWYRENKPRPFLGWGFLFIKKAADSVRVQRAMEFRNGPSLTLLFKHSTIETHII
ncbi:hypothetical protein SporoP33_13940 [Sporosarcina sp. P33]|nr:hypothetical protein SporoP33_13940 [Sporosarcina sp. P33]